MIIGLGLIVSPWILIPGAVAFALCAAGWLRDVARSHAPAEHVTPLAARDQPATASTMLAITTRNTVPWYWVGLGPGSPAGVAARADGHALGDRSPATQASILRAHPVPP